MGYLADASKIGQLAIPKIVQIYFKQIEWDEADLLAKLYPFTRTEEAELPRSIVVNPLLSFGQPILEGYFR